MPKRKRSAYHSGQTKRRRSSAASTVQRAFRRHQWRKRSVPYRTKKRPTVKKNAYAIRQLYKMSDPKYNLRLIQNTLIENNPAHAGVPTDPLRTFAQVCLNDIAAQGALPEYTGREADSVQVRLKNIRIHFSVHASPGVESGTSQKYYVALVKTTNGIGSTNGITMPLAADVFDATSTTGTLLAPWEGYRVSQGRGSDILRSTTFLKVWTGYLCPQGGDCAQNWQTITSTVPGTDISSTGAAGPGLNLNYTQDRPSQKWITYTHKCLNALTTYERATSTEPTNVKYFLVALSEDGSTSGFRLNASCKINFVDN